MDFQYILYPPGTTKENYVLLDAEDLGSASNGEITLATTSWSYVTDVYGNKYITSATVKVSTDSQIQWCTDADTGCPSATQDRLNSAVQHEFGHALGLDHLVRGPNSGVVMECITATGEYVDASVDDNNGGFYLYSDHPSDYGSPQPSPC